MMPQRDIEKLLGGYATDTLTEEERKELFAAALRDQTLFNALADEHALKEVLDDPRARRLGRGYDHNNFPRVPSLRSPAHSLHA